MTFDEVRQIALSFPEVEEYNLFGSPAFRIRKRLLTTIAKIDPDTLMVRVPNQLEREFLLSTKPEIYYSTEHYAAYNSLLVRIPVADPEELRELLEDAWMSFAPKRLVAKYQSEK